MGSAPWVSEIELLLSYVKTRLCVQPVSTRSFSCDFRKSVCWNSATKDNSFELLRATSNLFSSYRFYVYFISQYRFRTVRWFETLDLDIISLVTMSPRAASVAHEIWNLAFNKSRKPITTVRAAKFQNWACSYISIKMQRMNSVLSFV